MNLLNSSSTYDTLYPKVNLSNSQGTLPASQITSGTFGSGNYLIPGNLTLQSGNFGTKINLGDGDYVHISEPTDDCLEVKGKKINFVTSDTSSAGLTWNGNAIGGNSDSVPKFEKIQYTGDGSSSANVYRTVGNLSSISHPCFVAIKGRTNDSFPQYYETEGSLNGKYYIPGCFTDNGIGFFMTFSPNTMSSGVLAGMSGSYQAKEEVYFLSLSSTVTKTKGEIYVNVKNNIVYVYGTQSGDYNMLNKNSQIYYLYIYGY